MSANHLGHFEYHLCQLHDANTYESGEECFQPLAFEDGSMEYSVPGSVFEFNNRIKLPDGFKCERCVLRWHYVAANNWGICEDGSNKPGCGPQETFRSCSDIAIL